MPKFKLAKSKKENNPVVVCIEETKSKIDKDILNAIILSSQGAGNDYCKLDQHLQIHEKDLQYVMENGDENTIGEYVLAQRDMLRTAYDAYIYNGLIGISNIFIFSLYSVAYENGIEICIPSPETIINILGSIFPKDCCMMMDSEDHRINNIDSLTFINHRIPTALLKLEGYLKSQILNDNVYGQCMNKSNFGNTNSNPVISSHVNLNGLIESGIIGLQTILINFYLEVRDYANTVLYPLGYPDIRISLSDNNEK